MAKARSTFPNENEPTLENEKVIEPRDPGVQPQELILKQITAKASQWASLVLPPNRLFSTQRTERREIKVIHSKET